MGYDCEKDDIFTCGWLISDYLSRKKVKRVFVVGETGIINELADNKIESIYVENN